MKDTKTMLRFYTIADFREEEIWLREEHRNGWKLTKMRPPCFFRFEKCEPEDVIYRLYFRKPAADVTEENEGEIFSDTATKLDMIGHIMKTRMLPCLVILLCCVLPYLCYAVEEGDAIGYVVFFSVLSVAYLYLVLYCGIKLFRLKRELETGKY